MANMDQIDRLLAEIAKDPDVELASVNADAIRGLFVQLKQAVHEARLNTQLVAEAIGTPVDEARAILDGAVDLSLTDLEILLVAAKARIRFEVESFRPHRDTPLPRVDWKEAPTSQASRVRAPWETVLA